MKKIIGMMSLAALMFLGSCGGKTTFDASNPKDLAEEAIKTAKQDSTLRESILFGELPSLYHQKIKAQNAIKPLVRDYMNEKIFGTKNPNEEDILTMGKKEFDIKTEEWGVLEDQLKPVKEEASREINNYYQNKIADLSKVYIGKEIPVEYDKEQFSNVTVTVGNINPESENATFDFELILAKSFPLHSFAGSYNTIYWEWILENGIQVMKSSESFKDDQIVNETGSKITFTAKANLRNFYEVKSIKVY